MGCGSLPWSLTPLQVIKFVDKDAGPQLRGINAVDKGILELKTAVANSHVQIESIQQKIDELCFSHVYYIQY